MNEWRLINGPFDKTRVPNTRENPTPLRQLIISNLEYDNVLLIKAQPRVVQHGTKVAIVQTVAVYRQAQPDSRYLYFEPDPSAAFQIEQNELNSRRIKEILGEMEKARRSDGSV